jgi:hypothetical protein
VPRTVTSRAVRSYRTLSPLPDPTCVGHRRFALCCTGRGFPPTSTPLSRAVRSGRISSFEFYITFNDTCKVLHEFLDYKHKYLFLLRFHFYSVLKKLFFLRIFFTCVFDVLLNL